MSQRRKVALFITLSLVVLLAFRLPKTAFIREIVAPRIFNLWLIVRAYLISRPEHAYWRFFSIIIFQRADASPVRSDPP